jgi:hypothetical protein
MRALKHFIRFDGDTTFDNKLKNCLKMKGERVLGGHEKDHVKFVISFSLV